MRPKELLTSSTIATPVQVRASPLRSADTDGSQRRYSASGGRRAEPDASGSRNGDARRIGFVRSEGDKLTYQWTQNLQNGGPAVTLSAPNSAVTTFSAAAGQVYIFTLTVHNSSGLQSSSRVSVTVTPNAPPQIILFTATPGAIVQGSPTTLGWQVINADTVTISQVGNVGLSGSIQESPQATTTYQITATKGALSVTASATRHRHGASGSADPGGHGKDCGLLAANPLRRKHATLLRHAERRVDHARGQDLPEHHGSRAGSESCHCDPVSLRGDWIRRSDGHANADRARAPIALQQP